MQVEQLLWKSKSGWDKSPALAHAQLVIYFGGKDTLQGDLRFNELKTFYPKAHIVGCSTGGEIYNAEVLDDSVSVAAVHFSDTTLETAQTHVVNAADSFSAGKALAQQLNKEGLSYIFILSDGTTVNGSDLVEGLYEVIPEHVVVTGGLAGDGANFKHTVVGCDSPPRDKQIVAIGFYGKALSVGYGSVGGWKPFGPQRKITRSKDNVLYELDGKPALDLYKQYLGEEAKNLPSSGLFFPLSIKPDPTSEHEIVRTILAVDEKENSLIFAGDIPEKYTAQLMHGDFHNLVEGATKAITLAATQKHKGGAIAILVSCIGRKLLLGQSVSDETEAIAEVLEHAIPTIGFYSYGEICHQQFTGKCSLHNQTMTVTILYEK